MALFRTSNPALRANAFTDTRRDPSAPPMTLDRTVFDSSVVTPWIWLGAIGGLVVAIATVIKKQWSPVTAPVYAALEGLALGGLSARFETTYPGIVVQAVGLTFATLAAMLIAYRSGLIKPTEKFKLGVVAATGAIALYYLIGLGLSFFRVALPGLSGNGTASLVVSGVIVVVAALNLILDFDFIAGGVEAGAPKYMEWYGAFGLMVTLVWLYLEILRLLGNARSRR